MGITVRRVANDCWEAADDVSSPTTVRVFHRPDARVHIRLDPDENAPDETLQVMLDRIRADVSGELVHLVDHADIGLARTFEAAGFHAARTELTLEIAIERERLDHLRRVTVGADVEMISAADADLARLRALDEQIREDIPGSSGWRWTPEDFAWETFGSDFDPATYRVAVDPSSGEYLGLLRIWMKPAGPTFGCLGVRRDRRGTRVGAALLVDVFSSLLDRGYTSVITNVDNTNRPVLGVIERFEYQIAKHAIEYVQPAT